MQLAVEDRRSGPEHRLSPRPAAAAARVHKDLPGTFLLDLNNFPDLSKADMNRQNPNIQVSEWVRHLGDRGADLWGSRSPSPPSSAVCVVLGDATRSNRTGTEMCREPKRVETNWNSVMEKTPPPFLPLLVPSECVCSIWGRDKMYELKMWGRGRGSGALV